MPDPKRVEFITRHFKDLQSIRFAPIPALMLLAPLVPSTPSHVSKYVAWTVVFALMAFLVFAIGFYWWSTVAIKRRYGSVKESRGESRRMLDHPAIFLLYMITAAVVLGCYFFAPRGYGADVYCAAILFIGMLRTILDSTNPTRRRVVWAIGLATLFGAGPFLALKDVDGGAAIFLLGGTVWLSISIFDFLLLRRTFEEISSSASPGAAEAVADFG